MVAALVFASAPSTPSTQLSPVVRTFADDIADIAPPLKDYGGKAPTCFDGQITGPDADKIARAALILYAITADGHKLLEIGSGFKVADSGGIILSVAHVGVAEPFSRNVLVKTSSGQEIGIARPDAVARGFDPKLQPGRNRDDMTALRFAHYFAGGEKIYERIEGLALAKTQDRSGFLTGLVSSPAGLFPGASGGLIVNKFAEVVAVAEAMASSGLTYQDIERPRMDDPGTPGAHDKPAVIGKARLPVTSRIFGSTIIDHDILAALGRAGKKVEIGKVGKSEVQIVAFPKRYCVAYKATMTGLDLADPSHFTFGFEPKPSREAQARFTQWDDPVASMTWVKTLLKRLYKTRGKTPDSDFDGLDKIGSLGDLPADMGTRSNTSLIMITRVFAAASTQIADPILAGDIAAAAYNLPRAYGADAFGPKPLHGSLLKDSTGERAAIASRPNRPSDLKP